MLQEFQKVKDIWSKFQFILTKRQKQLGVFILFMTLAGAVVETMGVSVIVPFVQAMVTPQELMNNRYIEPFIERFQIQTSGQLVLLLGLGIAVVYIVKNLYLVLLSYCRVRYATKVQRELSVLMMQSYMKRGYLFFAQVNTGDLLRGVLGDVSAVYQIMYNAFRVFAELFTSIAIILFITRPKF